MNLFGEIEEEGFKSDRGPVKITSVLFIWDPVLWPISVANAILILMFACPAASTSRISRDSIQYLFG